MLFVRSVTVEKNGVTQEHIRVQTLTRSGHFPFIHEVYVNISLHKCSRPVVWRRRRGCRITKTEEEMTLWENAAWRRSKEGRKKRRYD